MNSQVWWFVARSSGIIAWALLTLSVVWGLLLSTKVSATRIAARKLRPAWILDLHRHLGGLAVIFTAIHLAGIVADSYVTFGWADILLPMASEWKPGAVAFGVVSMYLLLAIEVTSLAIRRLPRSAWRWVHRTSFVLFATATYHGIVAGTDAGNGWFRIASWFSIAVVVALTIRLLVVLRGTSGSDQTAAAAGVMPAPRVAVMQAPSVASDAAVTLTIRPVPTVEPVPVPAMVVAAGAATPRSLVVAIPPLPGTVAELATSIGVVPTSPFPPVPSLPPISALRSTASRPEVAPPTASTPPPPPPPPPPMRSELASVSSGGRGGDDLALAPSTT